MKHSYLLALGLSFASLTLAHGQIISDAFTDNDGTDLASHIPNVNVPGSSYIDGNGSYGNPTIEGDTVQFNTNASFGISIASTLSYTKPTDLTISADLETDTTYDDGNDRGVALGFFSADNGPQGPNGWSGDFDGLLLQPTGDLGLVADGQIYAGSTQIQAYDAADFGGHAFSTTAFYDLTYTVDTATGTITSATLSDVYGSQSYTFTTTEFTDTATDLAGALVDSGNSGTNAFIDNFSVSNASVPEPGTWALLLVGAVALLGLQRFRKSSI